MRNFKIAAFMLSTLALLLGFQNCGKIENQDSVLSSKTQSAGPIGTVGSTNSSLSFNSQNIVSHINHVFGDVVINTNSEVEYNLYNLSGRVAYCDAAALSNSADFEVTETGACQQIAPQGFCAIKLKAISSVLGQKGTQVTKNCLDSGAAVITGSFNGVNVIAVGSNAISFHPSVIENQFVHSFGSINTNSISESTFQIYNLSNSTVQCSLATSNSNVFEINDTQCSQISPQGSCYFKIKARPTAAGYVAGQIQKNCSGAGSVVVQASVTGLSVVANNSLSPGLVFDPFRVNETGFSSLFTLYSKYINVKIKNYSMVNAQGCVLTKDSGVTTFYSYYSVPGYSTLCNSVSAGSECQIRLKLQKSSPGAASGTLKFACSTHQSIYLPITYTTP